MATRIAWLLNLDAELELRGGARYRRAEGLDLRIAALVPRLAIVGTDDLVVGRDPSLAGADVALAFCPTPRALAALRAEGLTPGHTVDEVLLNTLARRGFSASLGQCLEGARYVETLDALAETLASPSPASRSGDWLLKRDFSFAGRDKLRVRDLATPGARGFAERSFARGEGLQVEPYCERSLDVAQHAFVTRDGTLVFGPPRIQTCDARGVWQASADDAGFLREPERQALARELALAGRALAARGYRGPFAIDAFRYATSAGEAFCARCEVNARFTMGYPRSLVLSGLAHGVSGP